MTEDIEALRAEGNIDISHLTVEELHDLKETPFYREHAEFKKVVDTEHTHKRLLRAVEQGHVSDLNLYELEFLTETDEYYGNENIVEQVDREFQKREKDPIGNEVFRCLFEGLKNQDEEQLAWAMLKIGRLIHENSPEDSSQESFLSEGEYPNVSPKNIVDKEAYLGSARQWINRNKSDIPIPFAGGTLSQRLNLRFQIGDDRKRNYNKPYIDIPIDDRKNYYKNYYYYNAIAKLFNIGESGLEALPEDPDIYLRRFEYKNTLLEIQVDRQKKFHKFSVYPKSPGTAAAATSSSSATTRKPS